MQISPTAQLRTLRSLTTHNLGNFLILKSVDPGQIISAISSNVRAAVISFGLRSRRTMVPVALGTETELLLQPPPNQSKKAAPYGRWTRRFAARPFLRRYVA